jgi:hypothetical protein
LQISPVGASVQTAAAPNSTSYPPPAYVQSAEVLVAPPVYPGYYPGYYAQPSYLPIGIALGGIALGLGYWGGYRGHHHWR